MTQNQPPAPSPDAPTPLRLFETMNAYQKTAALRAGIELDLFTAVGSGAGTPTELAAKTGAAERGVRILADYLAVLGFLTKADGRYGLAPDAAAFLDKRSPAYLGGMAEFMNSPTIVDSFATLTAAVRKGGTAHTAQGTTSAENAVWERFARAMGPMMAMPAAGLARHVLAGRQDAIAVLDVSASHGEFGLAFAKQNPAARVTGLDWANVLPVAKENAAKAGVADRYATIAGSAFDVDLGGPYDVVLLPNFLHHFDRPTIERFLGRVRSALKPGGRVATLEFVPNDDRVTPPAEATFSLVMLATTPAGDAYTFAELDAMFRAAGFGKSEMLRHGQMPHTIVVTERGG